MRIILLCAALLWTACAAADNTFPKPTELNADVEFWKRVYTEVDTSSGLLHDERNLGVVYEALRFPSATSTSTRLRLVEARKQYYQAILKRIAGKRDSLTTEEARVLALWPKGVSAGTLSQAVYDIRFQLGQSDRFREGLKRSGAWESYIRRAFAARGMPEELAVLPHVESSFNPDAYSKVGAAGMWQFIPSTGMRYMHIDHVLDERLDPYASTGAAIELLALNYAVTGTWPLAITAYNHGAAGMRRAAQSLGTRDIVTILRKYQSRTFGFASRNFYVSFLAALEVHRDAERYFPGLTPDSEWPLRTVEVPDFIPLAALSEVLRIDADRLRAHNQMLMPSVWRGEKYVPAGYALRLPPGTIDAAQAAQAIAAIPSTRRFAAQVPDEFHVVGRGDTLSSIAARYRVSMNDLMVRNRLGSANFIRVGQRILLPTAGKTLTAAAPASPRPPAAAVSADGTYEVRKGDTLIGIAARHGLSVGTVAGINNLYDADTLYPGQVLALPTAEPEQAAPSASLANEPPLEATLAQLEEAEPISAAATEAAGALLATASHPAPTADPADYHVAADGTIEVQAVETLGHYADWLGIRTQRLRDLNGLRFGQEVGIGQRLRLDFSNVDPETFVTGRAAYHRALQEEFFTRFRIEGVREQQVRTGDSLWSLAQRETDLPVWLLRQYNPDLDFANLHPGVNVIVPRLVPQANLGDSG
jgi:membrane-bound lytic murein transglycosylase D